jgi:hypothetical protein
MPVVAIAAIEFCRALRLEREVLDVHRVQQAIEALPTDEREELRRWMQTRWPPSLRDERITNARPQGD